MPQKWFTPMDYFSQGQQMAEPIAQEMRRRKAGEVASALMQSGDYTSPDMALPGVQPTLAGMMRMQQFQELAPIEAEMKRFAVGQAVNKAGQDAAMHQARLETEAQRAKWYGTRAENPSGQGKKYTGNTGNLMQLANDMSDVQEELAKLQDQPDPDPASQAMKMNRLQNHLETLKVSREVLLKKLEKEGAAGGGAKVSIAPDKDGKMVTKISGSLNDPDIQEKFLRQSFPDAPAQPDQAWLQSKDAEAAKWLGVLGTMQDSAAGSLPGETVLAEKARLNNGRQVIGNMLQKPASVADMFQNAPVAKPAQGGTNGPEAVRAAFKAGKITREQAKAALSQFGFQ